jgi:hypothetical protein
MEYPNSITINLPRKELFELFENPDNLSSWQDGLKSFEHLGGAKGEEGSSSRFVYAGRKGDLLITGTITKRIFPEEYNITYKSKGVYNTISNRFTEPEPGLTHWEMVNYFRFSGLMALMAPFMKSAFRSNTVLNMERFKVFAEQNNPQNH